MGNLLCCYIVEESTVTKRPQQVDVICETKTEDNVFVKLKALIRYRAQGDEAHKVLSELRKKNRTIKNNVITIIGDTVPKLKFDEVFKQKQQIANTVKVGLEQAMPSSDYGFQFVETLIIDIDTHECVKKAMNAKFAATKLNEAAIEKVNAEIILQKKRAQGEDESKVLSGSGIVGQTMAIVNGLKDQYTPKEAMEIVLVTRYFDALKETGASLSAAVTPHEAVTRIRRWTSQVPFH